MKRITGIILISFLLIVMLSTGAVTAKMLDKASPKWNSVNNSLLNNSLTKPNLNNENVLLWTPSEKIEREQVQTAAWAVPVNKSNKELSNKKDLKPSFQEEIKGVVVVIMQELPNCKNVKTFLYSAPVKTNTRIGILSTSEDIGILTVKESIVSALSTQDNIDITKEAFDEIILKEIKMDHKGK